ncbi:hypothetical protein [Kineosporia sp. R_H_3]|uniref:hypothetical protein n=1 Tax=Kineosporia sp. R_H_3 TaxID=1961848 RepID=UPI001179DDF8|nr:hypothetical protein [Kineosporia sp. R_H_3]
MPGRQGRLPASASAVTSTPAAARPHRLQADAGRLGTTLRLPVFVAVGAALGTAAHTAAAHALPDLWLLLPVVAAVTLCGLLIRGRERSFEAITAALLASQVVVHAVLTLAHPAAGQAGAHLHGAGAATGPLAHLVPDGPMLLAHLLAAGVAGWWLRRGEAAVWAAAGWVWPALALLTAVPQAAPAAAPAHWSGRGAVVLRDLTTSGVHPRRGPPVPAAA